MKKKATDVTMQMIDAAENALDLEPAIFVNIGDRPPNIMQVTSPNVMKTV